MHVMQMDVPDGQFNTWRHRRVAANQLESRERDIISKTQGAARNSSQNQRPCHTNLL